MKRSKRKNFFTKSLIVGISLLSLSACSSSKLAKDKPTGLWLGKMTVEQGTCPTDRMASLRIDKGIILFSPDDGALILRGSYNKKEKPQHIVAKLNKSDMDHKPYDMIFEGKPENENIIGTYGTPDCRASIIFARPNHYGLSDAIAH